MSLSMRNWAENPLRIAKRATFAAATIACLNSSYDATPATYAEDIPPLPSPTPRTLEGSYWDGMRHIIRHGNYKLATTKFCGGERTNPGNRQYVFIELQIDHAAAGSIPEFEIWDYRNSPPTSSRYPAKVEIGTERTIASLSKELPLGRYSFFVRRAENVERLLDQSVFECAKTPVVTTDE